MLKKKKSTKYSELLEIALGGIAYKYTKLQSSNGKYLSEEFYICSMVGRYIRDFYNPSSTVDTFIEKHYPKFYPWIKYHGQKLSEDHQYYLGQPWSCGTKFPAELSDSEAEEFLKKKKTLLSNYIKKLKAKGE